MHRLTVAAFASAIALIGPVMPAHAQTSAAGLIVDNTGWAALPLVQIVDARFASILAGPYRVAVGKRFYIDQPYDVYEEIISRDGVVRRSSFGQITYVSATEVCARNVGKKGSYSIAADRKARFTCRARTSNDPDVTAVFAAERPTAFIQATDPTEKIEASPSAMDPKARHLRGTVLRDSNGTTTTGNTADYTLTKGGVFVEYEDCSSPDADDMCELTKDALTSKDVPRLPAMASLKRAG